MSDVLINWFVTNLGGKVGKELILFIISMVPILELRGGLLAAGQAFLNIPMKGTKRLKPVVEKLEKKAMSQSANIEKYEFWGLVAFVGIPLPGTGAWTGALIAALLGIRFRKAFPAIVIGVCLAACIMTIISYGIVGGIFG